MGSTFSILKERTQLAHKALETVSFAREIMSGQLTRAQYGELIFKNHLIYHQLEPLLNAAIADAPIAKLKQFTSARLSDLQKDLTSFSNDFPFKNEENFKLNADSIAELIGTLYVLEGSRLGGNIIVKALRKNQNLSELSDFHFYGQSGINIRERWISLVQIGNSLLTSPEETTTAAEKATAVFQYFHAVFQPEKLSV